MKKIKVTDQANFSDNKNLFYLHRDNVVGLYDSKLPKDKFFLGWFMVFYDREENDREYITLNNNITYLDTLDRL